jgi:hypothetical protein
MKRPWLRLLIGVPLVLTLFVGLALYPLEEADYCPQLYEEFFARPQQSLVTGRSSVWECAVAIRAQRQWVADTQRRDAEQHERDLERQAKLRASADEALRRYQQAQQKQVVDAENLTALMRTVSRSLCARLFPLASTDTDVPATYGARVKQAKGDLQLYSVSPHQPDVSNLEWLRADGSRFCLGAEQCAPALEALVIQVEAEQYGSRDALLAWAGCPQKSGL